MIRSLIFFNILIVFTTSINAVNNVQTASSGSSIKKNLNKCCPKGKVVGAGKKCVNNSTTLTVSKIYDKDLYLTGKSFEDLFTLVPDKFQNNTVRKKLIDLISLDYNVYLTESGVVQVELPNAYDRWTEIQTDDYCIDVNNRLEQRFWINQPDTDEAQSDSNKYLTIATTVSCVFILLVLVVYCMLPELQNLCGMILMAYLFSLFMAFSLLIAIQIKDGTDNKACIPLACGIYFFFLAVFCWMSVMSYDMWWTFRRYYKINTNSLRRRRGKLCKFLIYCSYAWGVPLLMTIFLYVVNSYRNDMKHLPWFITPRIPENGCFLQGGVKLLYFYIPMLILIICNWIFYLMTAFHIYRSHVGTAMLDSSSAGHKQAHRDQKQKLMLYVKLSVVMGLSWLLEIISFVCPGPNNLWDIPDAYNSLIGLAMFLIFVCKKKIWKKLDNRYRLRKIMHWPSKSTATSNLDTSQSNIALQSRVSYQPNGQNSTDDASKENAHRRRETGYPAPLSLTSAL